MELKERESQKGKVCVRNLRFGLLDKLEISELWSRGVWGPAVKAPNVFQGKYPEIFGYLTLIRL